MKSPRVGMSATPRTATARRAVIATVIAEQNINSQNQLVEELAKLGFKVTQATLSRDLEIIGAVKATGNDGYVRYFVPSDKDTSLHTPGSDMVLVRAISELLLSAVSSGVMLVLHTPPGAAQFLAGHIDRGNLFDTLGTVAGDDTIFMVARSEDSAKNICLELLALAESGK